MGRESKKPSPPEADRQYAGWNSLTSEAPIEFKLRIIKTIPWYLEFGATDHSTYYI